MNFENIKVVLYYLIPAIMIELLIIPISFVGYGLFDGENKRLMFSVRLFDIFNVFGGFAERENNLFFVHFGSGKAFAFDIFDGGAPIKLKSLKLLSVPKVFVGVDLPISDNYFKYAIVGNFLANELFWLTKTSGGATRFRYDTTIGKSDVLKAYFKASVVFNALIVLIIIIGAKRKKDAKK